MPETPSTSLPAPTPPSLRRKLWIAAPLVAVLTVAFTGSALALYGADDRVGRTTQTSASTSTSTSTTGVDISGPCDEAEHANDPRCTDATDVASTAETTAASATRSSARDDARTESTSSNTSPSSTSTTGVDISGPCDEAEHANDPRCTGSGATRLSDDGPEDISGPCDEAEHVNDPRCAGGSSREEDTDAGEDSSGRGRGRGRGGDSGSD